MSQWQHTPHSPIYPPTSLAAPAPAAFVPCSVASFMSCFGTANCIFKWQLKWQHVSFSRLKLSMMSDHMQGNSCCYLCLFSCPFLLLLLLLLLRPLLFQVQSMNEFINISCAAQRSGSHSMSECIQ